jgi:hypothetical protein
MAVCSEIHTKHINALCGQNVEFWRVHRHARKLDSDYVLAENTFVHSDA